jgi:putative effector of murein hydrolase LrgA (UPF0299 family)
MQPFMLAGRHDAEIFGVIVLFVAIDMVHHAAFVNLAADFFLGHLAMFVLPIAVFIAVLLVAAVDASLGAEK